MPRFLPVAFIWLMVLALAGPALAASTFTVDSTGNSVNGGATTCASPCNLYQAITSSNNNAGTDTIHFSIPSIPISSTLPAITDPAIIDGSTGTGAPGVELSGQGGGVSGVLVEAPSTTIKGLVLNHFDDAGISIFSAAAQPANDVIDGNYIGTSASGNSCSDGAGATGNGGGGVIISYGSGHTIGDGTVAGRNVIACNAGTGIAVGANSSDAQIQGNYIGLLANGASGNTQATGVSLTYAGSTVDGNVISGNVQDGVSISGNVGTNDVKNNLIGTDPSGTVARGNGRYGVNITSNSGNRINHNVIAANASDGILVHGFVIDETINDNNIGRGLPSGGGAGTSAGGQNGPALGNGGSGIHGTQNVEHVTGSGNVIANNALDGLRLDAPSGKDFVDRVNFADDYYSTNGLLGIDMGGDGVTPNGPQPRNQTFADFGQNFPVLTGAATSGGHTTVEGTYNGLNTHSYQINFYPVSSCDSSGYGEGEATTFDHQIVLTDSSGDATFSTQLSYAIPPGSYVTATASDTSDQSMSEFSQCLRIPGATVVTTDPATDLALTGATIHGSVNPDGVSTTAHFEYGTTPSYAASTPEQAVGSDSSTHPVAFAITGLAPGTTFHYRVVSTNSEGHTVNGADRTFTTLSPAGPPAVSPPAQRRAVVCVVPKLAGKKLSAIKRALRKAHCKLGKVTRKHRRHHRKGTGLRQSIKPGKHKPAGTRVNVVLEK